MKVTSLAAEAIDPEVIVIIAYNFDIEFSNPKDDFG